MPMRDIVYRRLIEPVDDHDRSIADGYRPLLDLFKHQRQRLLCGLNRRQPAKRRVEKFEQHIPAAAGPRKIQFVENRELVLLVKEAKILVRYIVNFHALSFAAPAPAACPGYLSNRNRWPH